MRMMLMVVDRNNETPGCLARRLGQMKMYEAFKMHGVYAEVILNYVSRTEEEEEGHSLGDEYLNSKLEYDDSQGMLLDEKGAPVMMKWESEIMRQTAEILIPVKGKGRVLNIGFGMGIIDGYLQEREPEGHVIVEAHPVVIQRMKELQWDKKPNVQVYLYFTH
jgi:type IV protein arginine methyltransferase